MVMEAPHTSTSGSARTKEKTKNCITLASLEVARGEGAKPSTEPAAAINARAATLLTHAIG